ncbi:hypothetical protein CJF42_01860 [Pseudoalteromonas sp. NBT06-2]|uniref:hypothetical protein n=1 Tax=Pseudoalteromonas sp. NBT06-2 TaxID=2025950 RepID=UPI000BA6C79E|nr:hypothetical protein [Pseudoalteromonas sp. NBT06-2]PAJ76009.1 hypothetical protein CJF42_01860 [Pseudoalteromonas sp. NBT06-2]
MKIYLLFLVSFVFTTSASACDSFRLNNGDLLRCDIDRIELLAKVGQPISKDVDSIGVNDGENKSGTTKETWSYILKADIGGDFLVSVKIENSKVVNISSKQKDRL